MKKIAFMACAAAALAAPTLAHAADGAAQPFIGVSGGYHSLQADDELKAEAAAAGINVNDSDVIFGVVGGVDMPVGTSMFAGVEGNFHLGAGPIKNEYGASLRLGMMAEGGAKYYVRGGYQQLDIDPYKLIDIDVPPGTFDGIDTSEGDYLLGLGADFPVGSGALRINLDTISFDTVRATAGYVFTF